MLSFISLSQRLHVFFFKFSFCFTGVQYENQLFRCLIVSLYRVVFNNYPFAGTSFPRAEIVHITTHLTVCIHVYSGGCVAMLL